MTISPQRKIKLFFLLTGLMMSFSKLYSSEFSQRNNTVWNHFTNLVSKPLSQDIKQNEKNLHKEIKKTENLKKMSVKKSKTKDSLISLGSFKKAFFTFLMYLGRTKADSSQIIYDLQGQVLNDDFLDQLSQLSAERKNTLEFSFVDSETVLSIENGELNYHLGSKTNFCVDPSDSGCGMLINLDFSEETQNMFNVQELNSQDKNYTFSVENVDPFNPTVTQQSSVFLKNKNNAAAVAGVRSKSITFVNQNDVVNNVDSYSIVSDFNSTITSGVSSCSYGDCSAVNPQTSKEVDLSKLFTDKNSITYSRNSNLTKSSSVIYPASNSSCTIYSKIPCACSPSYPCSVKTTVQKNITQDQIVSEIDNSITVSKQESGNILVANNKEDGYIYTVHGPTTSQFVNMQYGNLAEFASFYGRGNSKYLLGYMEKFLGQYTVKIMQGAKDQIYFVVEDNFADRALQDKNNFLNLKAINECKDNFDKNLFTDFISNSLNIESSLSANSLLDCDNIIYVKNACTAEVLKFFCNIMNETSHNLENLALNGKKWTPMISTLSERANGNYFPYVIFSGVLTLLASSISLYSAISRNNLHKKIKENTKKFLEATYNQYFLEVCSPIKFWSSLVMTMTQFLPVNDYYINIFSIIVFGAALATKGYSFLSDSNDKKKTKNLEKNELVDFFENLAHELAGKILTKDKSPHTLADQEKREHFTEKLKYVLHHWLNNKESSDKITNLNGTDFIFMKQNLDIVKNTLVEYAQLFAFKKENVADVIVPILFAEIFEIINKANQAQQSSNNTPRPKYHSRSPSNTPLRSSTVSLGSVSMSQVSPDNMRNEIFTTKALEHTDNFQTNRGLISEGTYYTNEDLNLDLNSDNKKQRDHNYRNQISLLLNIALSFVAEEMKNEYENNRNWTYKVFENIVVSSNLRNLVFQQYLFDQIQNDAKEILEEKEKNDNFFEALCGSTSDARNNRYEKIDNINFALLESSENFDDLLNKYIVAFKDILENFEKILKEKKGKQIEEFTKNIGILKEKISSRTFYMGNIFEKLDGFLGLINRDDTHDISSDNKKSEIESESSTSKELAQSLNDIVKKQIEIMKKFQSYKPQKDINESSNKNECKELIEFFEILKNLTLSTKKLKALIWLDLANSGHFSDQNTKLFDINQERIESTLLLIGFAMNIFRFIRPNYYVSSFRSVAQ